MEIFKKFINPTRYTLVAVLVGSSPVYALDESALWLPSNYNTLYLRLKDAALAAEALDRCVKVVQGTIDTEQSTSAKPIFRILCRQENGRTYNEMVDGTTFETLTTQELEEQPPTEEEHEKRKADAWAVCEKQLMEKTRLMKDVEWLSEFPPKPTEYSDEKVAFVINFNAKNLQGILLRYTGSCVVNAEQNDASVGIRPRKD